MTVRDVGPLFEPASVAVVGASADPRKWGNWLARGALRGEARRPVYLVNRRGGELLGRTAYASLDEVPAPPELVVVAVPAAALEASIDAALTAGARAIVAITAGSAELDARLAARVREAGAVLLGPNCLGVFDAAQELDLATAPLPPGAIGLLSQSGNLALELGLLAARAGVGFSRFASLGNQADLGAAELIDALAAHEATRLIALYVEDFRDGRRFARAALDAGKPVLALAIARTEATGRAVRSHTGALASDGAAIDAACDAAGIHRVHTPQELIDVASALLRCRRPRGDRVAVLADGGGHGTIAAAVAERAGLRLPSLGEPVSAQLRAQLPAAAAVANPVDLAGGAEQDVHAFDRIAHRLLDCGEVDALLITGYFGGYCEYGPAVAEEELRTAALIGEAATAAGRPVITHTMYPDGPAAVALRAAGVPVYATVEQAVGALSALVRTPAPTGVPDVGPAAPSAQLSARQLLAAGGVPFAAERTVTDAAQALTAAQEIGYPVALKALGTLHKSDVGGVKLGLGDPTALRDAYAELERRLSPPACAVQRMAPLADGAELLIGARWDARFGPVVLAGAGGVHAELLRDTAVALAPVDEDGATRLLGRLRVAPLLAGARGRPRLDVGAAARALASLSQVAAAHPELAELEVNPLLVLPAGALALDARLVPRTDPTTEER